MRLNQFISSSGFCSRRRADLFIKEQKVTVNGQIIKLGHVINKGDRVEVDGQLILAKENDIYIMLNKPPGVTCTTASHIEGNIIDFVNYPEQIFPVGRLDKQSEGLILLTDDGSIVNALLREENNQEKDYIVTVDKKVTEGFIESMSAGVDIYNPRKKQNTMTKRCKVVQIDDYSFKITLSQGLNRQIRRMCRRFQYTVTKLQRVRIKNISLGQLEVGCWRYLSDEEVKGLKE
ncbi:pseudouridine synthase [Sporosarcina sp. G11-34]|uniref:pseudouridine synthase n=1 Tax=Sporosarcina sp. G11-34 TaxID=2849605 RepID=UPI0022A95C6A|nr:pseudouridine synthase [Sporosarcina sp. G11-34]MCZ2259067.1 pseudouridine synthase [Sporosarcina sp. G11-34]